MNLDVKEVCFEEEQDISNTREKSWKSKSFTEFTVARETCFKEKPLRSITVLQLR